MPAARHVRVFLCPPKGGRNFPLRKFIMASSTVTIGCKLPNGIILRIASGASVTLNGATSSRIVGGYGLTPDVDKGFWEAWKKEYATFEPFKNDLIFVQESVAKAKDQAREQADVKSGLEPLDKDKPAAGVQAENYEGKAP
jgi:hypothetical protein